MSKLLRRQTRRLLPYGLLAAPSLAAIACAAPQQGSGDRGPMVLRQGVKVRDFMARDRDGQRVHLGSYVQLGPKPIEQPREVLLTFFATWCRPCRHELPLLVPFQQENQGKVQVTVDAQGRVAIRMTGFRQGQSISHQLFEARRIR